MFVKTNEDKDLYQAYTKTQTKEVTDLLLTLRHAWFLRGCLHTQHLRVIKQNFMDRRYSESKELILLFRLRFSNKKL